MNIQSLTNKIDQLEIELNNYNIDVACITEHWLKNTIHNKYIIKDYEITSAFCRKNYKHGGTLILLKRGVEYENLNEINEMSVEKDIEIAAIKMIKLNIIVVSLYRSPEGNMDIFAEILSDALNLIIQYNTKIFIVGDFNINFLNETSVRARLFDLLFSYNLNITSTEPTRITSTSETCIDNIFTNTDENDYCTRTLNLHIADHCAQILEYRIEDVAPIKKENKNVRVFDYYSIQEFINKITTYQWECIMNNSSAATMCTSFFEAIKLLYEECFPVKRINCNKKHRQYKIPEHLQVMKNRLDALGIIAKTSKDQGVYREYYDYRTTYKAALEDAIREDYNTQIEISNNKTKEIWKIIRTLTGKSNQHLNKTGITPNVQFFRISSSQIIIAQVLIQS